MKFLRILVLLDTAFLMFLGFGMVLHLQPFPAVYPEGRQYETIATLRVLGTAVGGLALVVLATGTLSLLGNYRQFALWMSFANVLLATTTGIQQQAIWGSVIGWFLFLIPLFFGAALAWVGLRPLKPGEAANELATLRIPEEIRQALLRQIGEAAAQEERNRLARDLHDSIKQQLFTINVSTAAAQERWERDPDGARSMLADVRRSAKEAMVEMQALLHQLRPEALTSTGLVEALREQCEALGYRTGAEVTLELGEPLPDDRFLPGTEETLFRIAQEALGNVARHARARKVYVWLGRDRETARLRIEDDGQGFDSGAQVSGMGMRNLRERTESLKGTLEVVSAPGTGTTLEITIPLAAPAPEPSLAHMEKALRDQNWTLTSLLLPVAAFCTMRPLLESTALTHLFNGIIFTGASISFATRARAIVQSAQQTHPGAAPAFFSHLRYLSSRNRALAFFLAAVWVPWFWSLGQIWMGWTMAGLAVALVYASLGVFELVRFHRASEVRPRWWRGFRPTLAGLIASGVFLVWLVAVFRPLPAPGRIAHPRNSAALLVWPIGTLEILAVLFGLAVLIYIRSRQPRAEGAST